MTSVYRARLLGATPEYVCLRRIEAPTTGDTFSDLELIFCCGQNDVQAQPVPSLSVGDVIEYRHGLWLVRCVGFRKISKAQYAYLESLNPCERAFSRLARD